MDYYICAANEKEKMEWHVHITMLVQSAVSRRAQAVKPEVPVLTTTDDLPSMDPRGLVIYIFDLFYCR